MSPPWPRWLVAGSWVRSLWPTLCCRAAAGTLPLPQGKVMHHAEVRSVLPGQPKAAGCTKTQPQPTGRWWHIREFIST